MSKKQIGHWIDSPGIFWLRGTNRPVKNDDPLLAEKGGSSLLYLRTWRKVVRMEKQWPSGTRITKFIIFRGKRPGRRIVAEWITR